MKITRLLYRDLKRDLWWAKENFSSTIILPILWIFVLGFTFNELVPNLQVSGKQVSYILYIIPGIMAVQIMNLSSTTAISVFDDRKTLMMQQILMGPFSRVEYVLSKVSSAALQGMIGAITVLILTSPILAGSGLMPSLILNVVLGVVLGSFFFGCLGVATSTVFSTRVSMAVRAYILAPLTFLSSAYYPVESMPYVFQSIALVNPFTHLIDLLRSGLLSIDSPIIQYETAALVVCSLAVFGLALRAISKVDIWKASL